MASIQPLASSVSDELRASLVVNSLEQCAAELTQNSIDANATSIEIKVDVAGHSLQVSDNGDGISSADMERIGTRYATSKCSSLQDLNSITTYGFRGEAMAAVTEMSLVDIVSRPRGQEHVFSTIFKFPVRQRYWSDASTSKLEVELEKVKRTVETLALVTPGISFTVIDMTRDTKIMFCRKVDSQLHRINTLLGKALSTSLSFVKSSSNLDPVYSFSGYISTQGHYNRLCQYIFLNKRPVQCENLQRLVTHLFQQSSFATDSLAYAQQDVRRSRERHPIFVLMLTCPTSEYDLCADPSKVTIQFEDEERAFQVVRCTIIDFLERHHLLSRTAATALRHHSDTKKRKQRTSISMDTVVGSVPLDYISRVKISQPSRPSRPVRQIQSYDEGQAGLTYQNEIDVEDELEFELDVDWMATMLDTGLDEESLQLSKEGLRGAKVISQLDCKFILCTMKHYPPTATVSADGQYGPANKVLVVIDQHAADERSVEWLYRWGIVVEDNLPQGELGSLDNESDTDLETVMVSQHFTQDEGLDESGSAVSGTGFSTAGGSKVKRAASGLALGIELDYRQGRVISLPRVVADRCVVDGALTQDLVKDALSSFEEGRYRSQKLHSNNGQAGYGAYRDAREGSWTL
ncbi:DNA mismatch repair protein [Linnemannia zychae]|nr:DNA mismatch repair protein [Linnemannia zychae]